jgi:hypothetical protein
MWDWFSQEGPRRWEIVQRIDVGGECLSRGDGAHVALARRRAARRWGTGCGATANGMRRCLALAVPIGPTWASSAKACELWIALPSAGESVTPCGTG